VKASFFRTRRDAGKAFSLVEVVLAIAVISFSLLTIIGLFSIGLKTNKESSDQTEAADLASLILSTRRALPGINEAALPLPAITNVTAPTSNSAPICVAVNGTTLTNNLPAADLYNLNYQISPGSATNVVNVYILLWWPVGTNPPTNNSDGYYEISTQMTF
jgi:Tfp pilus assembly protein PilV